MEPYTVNGGWDEDTLTVLNATISGGETYYYESVACATNDVDNNSNVTVTANAAERR